MRKTLVIILALCLLLCSCQQLPHVQISDVGFIDEKNGHSYVLCSPFALKPITVGEAFCTDGKETYYEIQFEKTSDFLCDYDASSGSSYVYRNSEIEDISIGNFKSIAAMIYLDGKTPLLVDQFYADDEYLPEEKQGLNSRQETYLVKEIENAVLMEDEVYVSEQDTSDQDMYEIRLLSADYPGLYYSVIFFTDTSGNHYLEDMGTFKVVPCPADVEVRMIG